MDEDRQVSLFGKYRLRLERRRKRLRSIRKRRELTSVVNRTKDIKSDGILLFCTLRNERIRLPFFLEYYRQLGVSNFLIVENGSDDGSREFLQAQEDVSLWTSHHSYKRSKFGIDWLNWLLAKYGIGHWNLVVDVDEFFVYPFCDSRPLRALTDWLDASSIKSFGAMLVDMYPKGLLDDAEYQEGQDPLEVAEYFDAGNYMISRNPKYGNLWIQGGARARAFFGSEPRRAPALNKIPLVKWGRGNVYISSTHMLLPRGLNLVYDDSGGEKASGCLMHAKFLKTFREKSEEELNRRQHFANSHEYRAYSKGLKTSPSLWCRWSEKYINWRQLEILGLMSKGNWV
ncbi:MAG: glycosyltransferase family 2 protein [Rhodobacteraceae bacterium]|nr:glycosyltransferase family 2 protein [Paracoccaceae bacterium]